MPLNKKQAKLINDTWNTLENDLNNIDWTNYGKNYLAITLEESKNHDRFRGNNKRGMSILNEAKYFAIKRLWECFSEQYIPEVADFICIQKSCFYAYSIVKNIRFKSTWDKLALKNTFIDDMRLIASWDYCDLIR